MARAASLSYYCLICEEPRCSAVTPAYYLDGSDHPDWCPTGRVCEDCVVECPDESLITSRRTPREF